MRDRFFTGGGAGDTLSLGCGAGHLDRIFKERHYTFRSFAGIDISREAVERAQTLAEQIALAPSIRYTAADLNTIELPAESFDFIYFFQSLHHIEALERVLDSCSAALRTDGLLLVNEFVGPSRFQWTSRQLEMATELTLALPEDLRRDLQRGGIKSRVERPSNRAHDPPRSIRSGAFGGDRESPQSSIRNCRGVELGRDAEPPCVSKHRGELRFGERLPSVAD